MPKLQTVKFNREICFEYFTFVAIFFPMCICISIRNVGRFVGRHRQSWHKVYLRAKMHVPESHTNNIQPQFRALFV